MSAAARHQDVVDEARRQGFLEGIRSKHKTDTAQAYIKGVRDCLEMMRRIARRSAKDYVDGLILDDCSGPDCFERLRHYAEPAPGGPVR